MALKGLHSYDAAVQCAAFSAGAKVTSQLARYNAAVHAADTSGATYGVLPSQTHHTRNAQGVTQDRGRLGMDTAYNTEDLQTASMPQGAWTCAQSATHAAISPRRANVNQAGFAAAYTHGAGKEVAHSTASSSTAFAAAAGGNRLATQQPLTFAGQAPTHVARTMSSDSTATSRRPVHTSRAETIRREDVMASRKSMVPSMLAFLGHRDTKRPRHADSWRARN